MHLLVLAQAYERAFCHKVASRYYLVVLPCLWNGHRLTDAPSHLVLPLCNTGDLRLWDQGYRHCPPRNDGSIYVRVLVLLRHNVYIILQKYVNV